MQLFWLLFTPLFTAANTDYNHYSIVYSIVYIALLPCYYIVTTYSNPLLHQLGLTTVALTDTARVGRGPTGAHDTQLMTLDTHAGDRSGILFSCLFSCALEPCVG